jgi:hypothetical protein
LSHHLASAARSDRGHSFILLKDDGDQGRSRAERRLLPNSRQPLPNLVTSELPVTRDESSPKCCCGGTPKVKSNRISCRVIIVSWNYIHDCIRVSKTASPSNAGVFRARIGPYIRLPRHDLATADAARLGSGHLRKLWFSGNSHGADEEHATEVHATILSTMVYNTSNGLLKNLVFEAFSFSVLSSC